MKEKRSFVTIFTEAENFHLVKDVGQIPYFMHKTGGYRATLVTYRNSPDYPYGLKETEGLNIQFIKNQGSIWYFKIAVLKYIWSRAKNIDVLNLFHFKREHSLYLLLYKILNPKGRTYIKLDMNIFFFRDYNSFFYSHYVVKNYFLKLLASLMFRLTDIFSVETEQAKEYLLQVYPQLQGKLICIPNGVDGDYIDAHIPLKTFHEKENIILTAGRIGTFQKNTELLLESLPGIQLNDWKIYILGPIEPIFEQYLSDYLTKHPHLRDKIVFTGNISNRLELLEWYNRAKVFCLSSRFEGFPLAYPEALYFGNYIITTPVSSAEHITAGGKYGTIAPATAAEFGAAIEMVIQDGFLDEARFQNIRAYTKDQYIWPEIVTRLTAVLR